MRFLLLLPLLAFVACQSEAPEPATEAEAPAVETSMTEDSPASGALAVEAPVVSAAPAGGTGGVFLTLTGGADADTLVAARFAGAQRVEVHETYETEDGLRGMREVAGGIPVPAGETVRLRPGGYHVMLIELTKTLAEGDTVSMDLEMAQAGAVAVRVPVRPVEEIRALATQP